MDFSIVPFVNDAPVLPEEISVWIPPDFKAYADNLVAEVKKITTITGAEVEKVTGAQGRVQAVLHQIEKAREVAKAPVLALGNAIDAAAKTVSEELEAEKLRLANLLQAAAAAEQARRDAEVREAHEAHRRDIERQEAEILRLEKESQKLTIKARNAEDLEQAAEARRIAKDLEEAMLDAKYELEVRRESQVIEPRFSGPLIKGASSPEKIDKEIVDEALFLSQKPDDILRIAKVELKKDAVNDLIAVLRKKNKNNPNYDVVAEFAGIGVRLRIYRDPRIKQSAKVIRDTR